jgi:hypothetical protein
MPARRTAHRSLESEKDREFEKLLRTASRLQGTPQPFPRIKAPRNTNGKPMR